MIIFTIIFLISSSIVCTNAHKRTLNDESTKTLKKTKFENSKTPPQSFNLKKENGIKILSNFDNLPIMAFTNDDKEKKNDILLQSSQNNVKASSCSLEPSDRTSFDCNTVEEISVACLDEIRVNDLFDINANTNFCLKNFNTEPDLINESLKNKHDQLMLEIKDAEKIFKEKLTKDFNDDENILLEDLHEIISKEMVMSQPENTKVTLERKTKEIIYEKVDANKSLMEIQNDSTNLKTNEQNIKVMDGFNNISLPKHLKAANVDLKRFIKSFLFKKDQKNCLKRITIIEYMVKLFDKTKITSKVQEFYKISNDNEFEKELRLVINVFGNNRTFNLKNYSFLVNKISKSMKKIEKSYKLCWKNLSKEDRILIFYHEFLKLYNYAPQLPEILTLGAISTKQLVSTPTFLIHLINVFIEKTGNLKENKVLIKCLIYKALSYSSNSKKELFFAPKCKIKCDKKHDDLYFFMWEMSGEIQKQIQQLTRKGCFYDQKYTHTIYFKSVLVLFLYQHFIFLKFYGLVNAESIQSFIFFYERLLYTDECFACIFDEFMVLVRSQVDNL